jgi:hypothetical protein
VANLLNCQQGTFPFRYLGFPISDKKLTISDLEHVVATVGKRVEPWQGRFLSSVDDELVSSGRWYPCWVR